MFETLNRIVWDCWLVLGQMSPYLLFGFLVAGILSVCISPRYVERHLGGSGLGAVFKAALFGVPLPLCSCGVIPVSASLRRHGASRAATTSFLLSTPQTGVDSIAITYALLGPVFAIYRPIAALLTGFIGGTLVRFWGEPETKPDAAGLNNKNAQYETAEDRRSNVVVRILRYGFQTLPRDIATALLIGVVIAGAMSALIPPDQLKPYVGGGVVAILLLMAAGIPIYVCATASVPLAAAFIHLGASPGAALAFLITGPATNAATFTTIWKVLGKRTALVYLGTIASAAVLAGLGLDWFFPAALSGSLDHTGHHHAAAGSSAFEHGAAVVLLAVLAWSYFAAARARAKAAPDGADGAAAETSGRQLLTVNGMRCSHCAESVRRALSEIAGVREVDIRLADGQVTVTGSGLDRAVLAQAVVGLGYSVRDLDNSVS